MKFSVLASGSTGNAVYVESGDQAFIVDAGLTGKKMEQLFAKIDRDIKNYQVFLSHMNIQTISKVLGY